MSASEVDLQSKKKAQYSLYGATLILFINHWSDGELGCVGFSWNHPCSICLKVGERR